ncbi:penicillin-binding transpeptidase domain-containing protein, partial [Streptococcus suis]
PNTGTSRTARKEVVGKPVSKEAASKTRDYMVTVGTDPYYGTLYAAGAPVIQVGNQSVAVKSGTAQIAQEGGGGYLQGKNDTINSVVA